MVLVVKTNPNGLPLRHYVAPVISFSLAVIRAMGADIESAVIWRHHPDAAYVCVHAESGDVTLYVEEPYCRRGVAEWLDEVDPYDVSQRLVKYSAEYNAVGVLIEARGADATLEAVVYGPGSADYLGQPPIDAIVEVVAYIGDSKVETFYDLFKHGYERYVEFVRNLAKELRLIRVETRKGDIDLPQTYFAERIDATTDVEEFRDITRSIPIHRHRLVESVVEDVKWRYRPKRSIDVELVWNDVYEAIRKTFTWVGDLLVPKSPEAYVEFVSRVIDIVLKRVTTP